MKSVLLAVGLLIAIASPAQPPAPTLLRVGDPRISASALQPYKVRWKETIVNATNHIIERGTWDDELRHEQLNGRDVLVRVIVVTQPDGTIRENIRIVVDRQTFAPIRSEWKGGGLSYAYDFAGAALRGTRVNAPGGTPTKIDVSLPQAAFDYYGGMMELFLATLPRTTGAVFSFPAAIATTGAQADQTEVHWPLVEVQGEESARGAGGKPVKARRLETNTPYGFYKVWVIDTPPYIVRTVLLLGPGGRITYELV